MTKQHKPLKILAQDLEDLSVLSSTLQDALVPLADISYLKDDRQFVMAVNRFCWEDKPKDAHDGPFYRTLAGLRFDHVCQVGYRGLERGRVDAMHELLTVVYDAGPEGQNGQVVLHFAGGGAIRLVVERLACALEDLGEPWPTQWAPRHEENART